MGEEYRSRTKQITLRFDDEQMKVLLEKVKDAGISREEYIRTLIVSSVVEPKKRFEISDSDFEKLIAGVRSVGDKINQLAKEVNARRRTQQEDVELLREYYFELLGLYEKIILGNIKRWLYKMPERYAVIAVFLGQDPESTFGSQIENRMTKTFLELSRSSVPMKKWYVVEQVGVKEDSLDILCHNLNIRPFWEQRPKTEDPKKYRSSLYFTKDEWEYVQGQVKSQGFQSVSSFMRYCLNEVRDREAEQGINPFRR